MVLLAPSLASILLLASTSGSPVDQHAATETRHLLTTLEAVARNQSRILFGQTMTNTHGVFGGHAPYFLHSNHDQKAWDFTVAMTRHHDAMTLSDVKLLTGVYPALTAYDLGKVAQDSMAATTQAAAKDAVTKGMLVMMASHVNNLVTGGPLYVKEDHGDVLHSVRRILPGGDHNHKLHEYLDRIADFAHNFKDSQGRLVPFVFRPWHELNGGWFWWGLNNKAQNSAHDLQELYRHTVQYLRDVKGVHNILYAFSPGKFQSQVEYLEVYPGDDHVDVMAMDYYFSKEGCCSDDFLRTVKDLVAMAETRDKVAAIAEVGMKDNGIDRHPHFWTHFVLKALKSSPQSRRLAFLCTWVNRCSGEHHCDYWVPYQGHPAQHDFHQFFLDPFTVFLDRAPRFYL